MHNNLLKVWNIHETLLLYCLKRTEKVDNKNPNFVKRIKGRRMILSNSVAGGNKKMRFIKKEEASRLSSMLEKGDSRYAYQNEPNLALNIEWLMGILRIYPEERLLIIYYKRKHLA